MFILLTQFVLLWILIIFYHWWKDLQSWIRKPNLQIQL